MGALGWFGDSDGAAGVMGPAEVGGKESPLPVWPAGYFLSHLPLEASTE